MQPCNLQPAEPSSIADQFSHIGPLSPEAVLVEEIDDRSRQEVENVPEMVYNSPTNSREAQNNGSDGTKIEYIRQLLGRIPRTLKG